MLGALRWKWTASTRPLLAIFENESVSVYNLETFALVSSLKSQENEIKSIFWSDFEAILAVVSTIKLSVFRGFPQPKGQWNFVLSFDVQLSVDFAIHSVHFAPNSEHLIVCCEQTMMILGLPEGLMEKQTALLEIEPQIMWKIALLAGEMAKFSKDPTVFATLEPSSKRLCVWKMTRISAVSVRRQQWKVEAKDLQAHAEEIDSFSWNLTNSLPESPGYNVDRNRRNRLNLLTEGNQELCIWAENVNSEFVCYLRFYLAPEFHFGWVECPKDYRPFMQTPKGMGALTRFPLSIDWIAGWNASGDVRIWRVHWAEESVDIEETKLCVRLSGTQPLNVLIGADGSNLRVFSRKDDRFDCYSFAIQDESLTLVSQKSWTPPEGEIIALANHPMLPLIAFAALSTQLVINISWISSSIRSSDHRIVPCGKITRNSEPLECIQWIPSSHFDAIPLLLLAFSSGRVEVCGYSQAANSENWSCIGQLDASPSTRICVCPSYTDGAFVSDTFVLLAHGSSLEAWKCCISLVDFEVHFIPLTVPLDAPSDITCLEGGRLHPSKAFARNSQAEQLHFHLFVGNRHSMVQYWRCSLQDTSLCLYMMSSLAIGSKPDRIMSIRMSDINRIAVLTASEPQVIQIVEAESGLGTLRVETSIQFTQDVQSFSWRSSHLTSYFDELLVLHPSGIAVHRCTLQGDWAFSHQIATTSRLFDCTHDASASVIVAERCPSGECVKVAGDLEDSLKPKMTESLPFWHPFVLLTTLFGMHARSLDGLDDDMPNYDFEECFRDTIQLLKRFTRSLQDEALMERNVSRRLRIHSELSVPRSRERRLSSMSQKASDCARNLFVGDALGPESDSKEIDMESTLTESERQAILSAVQKDKSFQAQRELPAQLSAILDYVFVVQALPFDLATAADLCGIRFYLALLFAREAQRHFENCFPSSSILWALHSDSQPFLIDKCFHPKASWEECRYLWPGLWVRDISDLRQVLERLAKARFTASKDVRQVCLHYAALGRQSILCGLAKLGSSEECKHLATFLEHDFSQERWSLASIKNAYALLAKKRFELAAAFFLLCEPPRTKEAVHILWNRMQDPSLALVIARVTENRSQPLTYMQERCTPFKKTSLEVTRDFLLQYCRKNKDRWMESAALWWLEDYEQACTILLPLSLTKAPKDSSNVLPVKPAHQFCFFMDLTSLSLYFEWIYSKRDTSMLRYAMRKMALQKYKSLVSNPKTSDWALKKAVAGVHHAIRLVPTIDIEHAFSYSAQVCKRCGLIDTALMEMLRAHRLLQMHSRWEKKALETIDVQESAEESYPSRPILARRKSEALGNSDILETGYTHSRRLSTIHWTSSLLEASKPKAPRPWLRTQINDVECRKLASSLFVGRLIGQRVAQEIEKRLESDMMALEGSMDPQVSIWDEIWGPLCDQYAIDRSYALERAMYAMLPHALEHITACCVVLFSLGRVSLLEAWLEYIASLLLHDVIQPENEDKWPVARVLLMQMTYVFFLESRKQLKLSSALLALLGESIRAAGLALAWRSRRYDLVQVAVGLQLKSSSSEESSFKALWALVIFLEDDEKHVIPSHSLKSIYLAVLLHASLEKILSTEVEEPHFDKESAFSCLHVPKKLWRPENSEIMVLLRQWLASLTLQLCQILRHRSLPKCLCGHYGLENAHIRGQSLVHHDGSDRAIEIVEFSQELVRMYSNLYSDISDFVAAWGITTELHDQLLGKCDEYILHLMQHEQLGVEMTLRRLRGEPRIYIKCFVASKAVVWLQKNNVFDEEEATDFLKRCCKQRKLRLLATLSRHTPGSGQSELQTLESHQTFMFVDAWEVEAQKNTLNYLHHRAPAFVELGWERLVPCTHKELDRLAAKALQDQAAGQLWSYVNAQAKLQALLRPKSLDPSNCSYFNELFVYCQRNALLQALGLPHRFIGVIKVTLVEASGLKDVLLASSWNKPYAFLQLENGILRPSFPDSWSLNTYRSSVGSLSVNPKWDDQEFVFRFAIPTHSSHSEDLHIDPNDWMERLWSKREQEDVLSSDALQKLCRNLYRGPPTILHCTLYSKNKLFPHQFLGHGAILLEHLTSSMCMDSWVPLVTEDRHPQKAGKVHLQLTLAFELMCTSP